MGNIPIYTSKVSGLANLPATSGDPNAFGAQMGAALQSVGASIADVGPVLQQQQDKARAQEVADKVATFDYSQREAERKAATEEGAPGYAKDTVADYTEYVNSYVDSVTDPKARQALKTTLMARLPQQTAESVNFEFNAKVKKSVGDTNTSLNAVYNKVRTDPSSFDTALKDGYAVIDHAQTVDGTTKGDYKRKFESALTRNRFDGMISNAQTEAETAVAEKQLADKTWQARLDPSEYNQLQDQLTARKTQIVTAQKAQVSAVLTGLESRDGDPTQPIPREEVLAAQKLVDAFGTPEQQAKFYRLKAGQTVVRNEGGLPASEIRARKAGTIKGSESSMMEMFQADGFSKVQAAAIIGNFIQESSLRPGAVNKDDGGPGQHSFGIGQWNRDRLADLKRFAADNNMPIDDVNTQMKFVMWELDHSPAAAGIKQKLLVATTVDEATAAFVGYERPQGWSAGDPRNANGWRNRLAHAERLAGGGATDTGVSAMEKAENDQRDKIITAQEAAMKTDMMTYADGVGTVTNAGLDTPEGMQKRGIDALKVADYYGVAQEDATPLTKDEVQQIAEEYKNGDATQRLELLTSLQGLGPEMARAAYKQLGQTDNTLEWAAGLAYDGGDRNTAIDVIRGQRRLDQDPKARELIGASDKDMQVAFQSSIGQSFNAAPRARSQLYDASVAHYLETQAMRGTTTFDAKKFDQSVKAVAGNSIGVVNGEQTVLPPGVTDVEMEKALDVMTSLDWAVMSKDQLPPRFMDGQVIDPKDLAAEAKLRALGGGEYTVEMSDGLLAVANIRPDGQVDAYVFVPDAKYVKQLAAGLGYRTAPYLSQDGQPIAAPTMPVERGGVVGNPTSKAWLAPLGAGTTSAPAPGWDAAP